MNILIDKIYSISNWILRLMYINLLWLLFSLGGLIIFGFFPSTVAMFAVVRKFVLRELGVSIFGSFLEVFKKEFLKSNLLGLFLSLIGMILYTDYWLLQQMETSLKPFIFVSFLFILFLYLVTLFYVFPIFVHYDVNVFHSVKDALLMAIINPFQTIKALLGLLLLVLILLSFPGLTLIAGGSLLSFFVMYNANQAFRKYENKRKKISKEIYAE